MSTSFAKFAFLAVLVGVVLFSRAAYPGVSFPREAAGGESGTMIRNAVPPLFVLPAVSAEETGSVQTLRVDADGPRVQAAAWLIADLPSGDIIRAKDPDRRWPTASVTKLMTATVAADHIDPATKITITPSIFAADVSEPNLATGGAYKAGDLMRLMLLPSSNVAAEALATFYGRGKFLDEMNARAVSWGMQNSYFGDPSGISAANQSTASDLLKLAEKIAAQYPSIFQITRTPQATITEVQWGTMFTVKSINAFAGDADFVGGKTGYTNQASGNLLSVFRYGGHSIAIIVLGTNDRFGDTRAIYDWWKKNAS